MLLSLTMTRGESETVGPRSANELRNSARAGNRARVHHLNERNCMRGPPNRHFETPHADDAVNTLQRIVERRARAPEMIRRDNGPEFISQSLRDWCRFNDAKTGYIEPGAPWQNPFVESFNGRLRRELLEMEGFNTLFEAQLLLDDWRQEHNHYRHHQSLNYMTPAEYARRCMTDNQPELS